MGLADRQTGCHRRLQCGEVRHSVLVPAAHNMASSRLPSCRSVIEYLDLRSNSLSTLHGNTVMAPVSLEQYRQHADGISLGSFYRQRQNEQSTGAQIDKRSKNGSPFYGFSNLETWIYRTDRSCEWIPLKRGLSTLFTLACSATTDTPATDSHLFSRTSNSIKIVERSTSLVNHCRCEPCTVLAGLALV